jgi:hypothetical protein
MTKPIAPMSFEGALAKIVYMLGWDDVAAICKRSVRTVRNWTDAAARGSIRLDQARELDLAYRRAGGEGAPMLECYALSLEALTIAEDPCGEKLADRTSKAAKEAGEAISALIDASRRPNSAATRIIARREAEEAISALTAANAALGPEA